MQQNRLDGFTIAKLVVSTGVGLAAGVVTNMALAPVIGMTEGTKKAVAVIGGIGIAGAVSNAADNYVSGVFDGIAMLMTIAKSKSTNPPAQNN